MTTEEMSRRYMAVYTPAVADALDTLGFWHQLLDPEIKPLTLNSKVAGPAFTLLGTASRELDKSKRLAVRALDQLSPGVVVVIAASGERTAGHWGELLTHAARHRGCTGAVIDGGLRDTLAVMEQGFPVFHRYRSPGDGTGRFNVVDFQVPVVAGGVRIRPGDFVVGDADGVVVVPREVAEEVLLAAERIVETEKVIRARVQRGESVAQLYQEYERF